MAEMTENKTAETEASSCCSTEAQASCCEPSDKASCCAASAEGKSCGCSAGGTTDADDVREAVRARYAAGATSVSSGEEAGASGCAPDAVLTEEEARSSVPASTATSTPSSPTPRRWPRSAAATRPRWRR